MKVLLDTDIGTDVDDCLALALLLASPEAELVGVTTVYGDTALRARIVLKLLALRGVSGVPVALGAEKPLLGKRPVYWEGHEGQGLVSAEDETLAPILTRAPDFIVDTVMALPREIVLIAIGPLTNVALALLSEPRLAHNLAGLVVMGGVVGGAGSLHLPWTEHNFRCDPEAAHIVVSSGAALTVVPLDVTTQVRIGLADVAATAAVGDPYHLALADQITRYPRFYQRGGWTYLHDPLAVASLLDPTLLTWHPLRAVVEMGGEHTAGKLLVSAPADGQPPTAQVALGVEAVRAERFIVERLRQGNR